METYERDIERYKAFMDAFKRHGLDYLKRAWDFEVCPKEIAKKHWNMLAMTSTRYGLSTPVLVTIPILTVTNCH